MTAAVTPTLTIDEFLKLPYIEASPAWEYINGVALQKHMPKAQHAISQKRLLAVIDQGSETDK